MSGSDAGVAAAYYDDKDIFDFYRLCWGGSDIHIGRYDTGDETVAEASAAMTRHLLELAGVAAGDRALDIACGFGGTLRLLAGLGCRAAGIDISRRCVAQARSANAAAGLAEAITVDEGDFHAIDAPPDNWDVCICQESLIHSPDRPRVFSEVFRVLRPGGVFVFSDILTAPGADLASVDAAFARLGVRAGATPDDYTTMATGAGFVVDHVETRPADIKTHYAKLAGQLAVPVAGLAPAAAERIAGNIAKWQQALDQGEITWACFRARKPV
jgi:sarcosine/dimethylglycine N-methyltransferase